MTTWILGISAYYHDSAACLLRDGEIVAAAQEERFTRRKHDADFPTRAVEYCLSHAEIRPDDLAMAGFYEKPLVKFERLLQTYIATAPRGLRQYMMAMPAWLGEKLWTEEQIRRALGGYEGKLLFGEHHESHAASAFYPSPFEAAAVLTIDGVGEWATSSIGRGHGSELELLHETRFPHSLGLLYSAFTHFTGFRVNSGEYKLMGLAPYGEPRYVSTIRDHVVEIGDDGFPWLNMEYFNYTHGLTMTSPALDRLFGGPARLPESPITQREMDIARSIQAVTEESMLRMAAYAHRETGLRDLCLAGGVALNCVGNGRILREGPFEQLWIQPAAGDAGGAVGIALNLWHRYLRQPRTSPERAGTWVRPPPANVPQPLPYADGMKGALLGPSYSDEEIGAWIAHHGYEACRLGRAELCAHVASLLAEGRVIGLFQGRMEFGPRALGGRSIIGDARSREMQTVMNLKIKFRESFRPFAPSVLREHAADWFDLDEDSPYMLLVADVRESKRLTPAESDAELRGIDKLKGLRSQIPAVTHVDYSARIQTVRQDVNPLYHGIIQAFYERTGCPVIVNTSFNVRGEPIVCTPDDAYRCFMRTNIDVLVLESYVLTKDAHSGTETGTAHLAELALD